jgi:hypothetical protein
MLEEAVQWFFLFSGGSCSPLFREQDEMKEK